MKFRVPEIFLGAFLTVAVFAMGMTFSSVIFPNNNSKQQQSEQQQATEKTDEHGSRAQSLWVPTDSVGLYTLVLAVFTGLLVGVSGFQGYFLLRADKTARIAANAAALSAKAAIAIELPAIRTNVGKIGWADERDPTGAKRHFCYVDYLSFSNLGRSRALPIEVELGWTFGDKLPDIPIYISRKQFTTNTIYEPDSGPYDLRINDESDFDLPPDAFDRLREQSVKLWFYCNLIYPDFMQTRHEAGFCWRRYQFPGEGRFVPEPASAYNQKT